jgi:hypothetical protein
MVVKAVLTFLLSAALLFVALKYGFVGGGGGVTSRYDQPVLYWIGVAVTALIAFVSLVAFISGIR